ncbi:MAG: hypothetical protein NC086_01965 [Alistipes sp.]|nr:hypothetical protein [Alistipes sp.]
MRTKLIALVVIVIACFGFTIGIYFISGRNENRIQNPTGYPSDELDQPQIMYNDTVYYYYATGIDKEIPDDFSEVGSIKACDNENIPGENFTGARVEIGKRVYASEEEEYLYIEFDSGYAKFYTQYPADLNVKSSSIR